MRSDIMPFGRLGFAVRLTSLVAILLSGASAQTSLHSGLIGTTPPAMAAGAPLGAYSLSEIEQINHFNGNLNLFVPLRKITGRGESGFTSGININKRWYVQHNLQFNVLQA